MRALAFLKRPLTGALWLALTGSFLVIGWWPLDPFPRNRVRWAGGSPGLDFQPPGVVVDDQLLPWSPAGAEAGFTLELQLQPKEYPRGGTPHLLTVHDGELPSRLVLCQRKDQLILRVPDPTQPLGYREAAADILPRKPCLIAVTCSRAGTTFFADGRPVTRYPRFLVPPDSLRGRLLLGDSADGKHAWTGRLAGVAVIHRALDAAAVAARAKAWNARDAVTLAAEPRLAALYLLDEGRGDRVDDSSSAHHRLNLTETYVVPQRTMLEFPRDPAVLWRSHYLQDTILNLLGFVPFGFLAFRYLGFLLPRRPARAALLALFAGSALTLTIELVQVWLPTRVSSGTDVILNILGTIVGIGVAAAFRRWEASAQNG